jgi:hypothetical protein
MSIEDFIKKEYGARSLTSTRAVTNKSRRKKKTNESFEKYFAKFYNPNAKDSLAKQRADMRDRRSDFSSMVDAGVISTTKQGVELLGKIKDKETRPEVVSYMSRLSDSQISELQTVFDRRVQKMLFPSIARGIFNDMTTSAREQREQTTAQVDTTLGFGNALKKGASVVGSLVDEKGFSVDLDPFKGEYFVRYKKEF